MNNVKLLGTILSAPEWARSPSTKVVWITLLLLADKTGFAPVSIPGLAGVANVTPCDCEAALRALHVAEVDGGLVIPLTEDYRILQTPQQEKATERQRLHRLRHSGRPKPKPRAAPAKRQKLPFVYPADFELWWKGYPSREGSLSKRDTFGGWNARQAEGHDVQALYDGCDRYSAYVRARAWTGTRFVMQPETFLGPGLHFTNEWAVAPEIPKPMKNQAEHDLGIAKQPQVIEVLKTYRSSLNGEGEAWWSRMKQEAKQLNRHPVAYAHEWVKERRV